MLLTLNTIAGICLMTNGCTALTCLTLEMSDLARPPVSKKQKTNGNIQNVTHFCINASWMRGVKVTLATTRLITWLTRDVFILCIK